MDTLSGIRVVHLCGEEFQRMERLNEIIEAAVDPGTRDFNMDVFTPETFKLGPMADILMTFPMMAARRVVVIRNFDGIHPETRKKTSAVLKDTPDTTLAIVESEKAKLVPKPPAKYFLAETFKQIYENRLPTWIQGRFAKRGKKVNHDAVALLINNVGDILRELDNEIEKITITAHDRDMVTKEDVSMVVGEFRHDTVWNLCNAIGMGNLDQAAGIMTGLMETEKNKETVYIASIMSHIMKIGEYNSMRSRGIDHNEAMKTVTPIPFLWKLNKMDTQVKNFGRREVRRAMTILSRADSKLKKHSINKRLMMEILLPLMTPARKAARTTTRTNT